MKIELTPSMAEDLNPPKHRLVQIRYVIIEDDIHELNHEDAK